MFWVYFCGFFFKLSFSLGTMVVLLWAAVWSVTGPECLPGGNLFGILVLFYCAVVGGKVFGLIRLPTLPPLPPLLGECETLLDFLKANDSVENSLGGSWEIKERNTLVFAVLETKAKI